MDQKKLWKNENWWTSEYNYEKGITDKFKFDKNLKIHDATLRDGEQTPGVVFSVDEKIEIARMLSEAGVHRIEAGMPAVSSADKKAIMEIKKMNLDAEIFSFVRAKDEDIEMSKDCGVDGVIIEVPIGKPKLELQFEWDIQKVINSSIGAINKAKDLGMYTVFFPYDTTRADRDDIKKLLKALKDEAMPDAIGVVDTMGCAIPGSISYLVGIFAETLGIPVEVHTHNDFGLALANTIEGLSSGAQVAHCCINGMGERTGNCSLEEIVVTLKLLYGVDTGIDIKKLVQVSKYVEEVSMFNLSRNKPIVGVSNFTRESGIGVDCLFTKPLAMFAVNPSYFGRTAQLVLGKKSGMTSINVKLEEMSLTMDETDKKKLLMEIKQLGIDTKALVSDEQFTEILGKYL